MVFWPVICLKVEFLSGGSTYLYVLVNEGFSLASSPPTLHMRTENKGHMKWTMNMSLRRMTIGK